MGAFAHAWTVAGVAAVIGIIGLVAAWLLFHQRSARTGAAIDRELLGDTGLTLADVKAKASGVHHVICTTELQTGEPFYFTNRVVYGYRFGASTNAIKLPLSTAVQASACVPGAFAPRMIPLATLGVHAPTNRAGVVDPTITSIVIDDGGVYDNMSDQWEYGFGGRLSGWPELGAIQPDRAKFLIVVNGSGGWNDPKPIGRSGFAQEVQGLLRAQAVQYDVSTADRRQALYAMFRHAETGTGQELDGIFAQITDSPYRIPKAFCSAKTGHSDAMARRADAALAFLADQGYTEVDWDALVGRTSGAATTLARLGTATTAELLEHGYVLTMVNLYVLDDTCPLRPIDRDRFRRLCS